MIATASGRWWGKSLLFAAGFLALHVLMIAAFPQHVMAASYPLLIAAPLLATLACLRCALQTSSSARLLWGLTAAGLALWLLGICLSAWEDLAEKTPVSIATASDFVFLLYGALLLLAISLPTRKDRVVFFVWLDGIQVTVATYLAYVALFAKLPFTGASSHPISMELLTATYNVENVTLVVFALVRFAARPAWEERRFYGILSSFLVSYAVSVAVYNHMVVAHNGAMGLYVPLADVPFLVLAVATMLPAPIQSGHPAGTARRPLTLFVAHVSPIFFTASLLALGLVLFRSHEFLGGLAVGIALVVYAVRNSLLQGRYAQSEGRLREARDELERISLTDGLTGIANRRCFDQELSEECKRRTRSRKPLSLLMVDVDFFKALNDSGGHTTGDECLVQVAAALQKASSRISDVVARYGGEEFALILPGTDAVGARTVAERIQQEIEELAWANPGAPHGRLTVSIGVAVACAEDLMEAVMLVRTADEALYRAKENGRNRVEFAE